MKRIISLVIALMLVFSLALTSFAATDDGTITVNGVSAGTDYNVYRLLDLESFNKDSGAYSYTVNSDWTGFFATAEAKNYVTIGEDGYVSWKASEEDAVVAAFAKKALAYAKANSIAPVKSSNNAGEFVITDTVGKFSNLPLGWYLLDSSAGALCGLTTTDRHAVINAKNGVPTIDKQVQEDLSGLWGDVNTADIGQIVNYMTIIHVAAGAENYKLHDAMGPGLTFEQDLTKGRGVTEIKHIDSLGIETTLVANTNYTVQTSGIDADCDFEIVFDEALVAQLKANERIIVYYNAMLNRNAVIAGSGNPNETWLTFAESKSTAHDKTHTFTYAIDIVKTDSSNKLIDGAKFRVYDASTGGNEIHIVPLMEADDVTPVLDENGNPKYRRARADEFGVEIVVKDGIVTVVGFDNGIYYLEETAAPDGYNKLTARKEFTIADGNLDSIFTGGIYSTGSGVHVVNKTGSMLPETGAMGTMMFITFGVVVMMATGVLLVTKKRLSMIEE